MFFYDQPEDASTLSAPNLSHLKKDPAFTTDALAAVDVLLGGRAAEEVFLGEISTGAGNDLERATDIIKAMVSIYGMSDVAGLMVLEKQRNTFLNGGTTKDYSEKMAEKLDEHLYSFHLLWFVVMRKSSFSCFF